MDLAAWLGRIGYHGPTVPSAETLRAIHRAHLLHVPFENLDIHAGRRVVLDHGALYDKIVRRRRGGFCYELNGLFAAMLRGAGFDLDLLSARVATEAGDFGPELDHLAVLVRVGGERWLADVGFGDSFLEPLRLDEPGPQPEGESAYVVALGGAGGLLARRRAAEERQLYRFDLTPRRLAEFEGTCHYHQTSPLSPFTRQRLCTRATPRGRVTLAGSRLIVTEAGTRTERDLGSADEVRRVLAGLFGIAPDSG
jgi:N-hydroxyarylamine O-acetyltransferase